MTAGGSLREVPFTLVSDASISLSALCAVSLLSEEQGEEHPGRISRSAVVRLDTDPAVTRCD